MPVSPKIPRQSKVRKARSTNDAHEKESNSETGSHLKERKVRQCDLGKDDSFLAELSTSLILETTINMSVESVESIMAGLGFGDAIIRGLSQNTFLAYFPDIDNLEEVDLDFMSIGFNSIKKVDWNDTIPRRRVNVEIRSLPLIAWTKENCQLLTGKWGDILNYYPIIDSNGAYQVPRIRLETKCNSSIYEPVTISIDGNVWNILLVELVGDTQQILEDSNGRGEVEPTLTEQHNVKDDVWIANTEEVETLSSTNSLNKSFLSSKIKTQDATLSNAKTMEQPDIGNVDEVLTNPHQDKVDDQVLGDNSDHEDSSGSLINPTTSSELVFKGELTELNIEQMARVIENPTVIEVDEGIEDWNLKWQVRDISSDEATASHSLQSQKSSILDDMVEEILEIENGVLLTSINKMRIKSKRGGPSNGKAKTKENKAFKVPRRRKIKGMKLGLPVIAATKGPFDEAKFVYESALNMGLIPDHSEEKSLKLIRANLGN